jgi:CheY-like chemotaxis protein
MVNAPRRRLEGVRLLVVDDDEDTLELMGMLLERTGAQVTLASSGACALDVAVAGTDVVLTDLAMADMGGAELVAELRRRGEKAPCVAVTGAAKDVPGFDAHIQKPVDVDRLVELLVALLRTHASTA